MIVLKKLQKLLPKKFRKSGVTIPVVRMEGVIGGGSPMRPGLNLSSVAGVLDKAFGRKEAPAVAVVVNSPGGSPVQSRLIFRRLRDLAKEKEKEILVFVEDVAASGGYMIAIAGDEIYVDPSSVVGSIGVVSAGFGFPELLKKAGVERRVYTAGENKVILDPFQPEKEEDIAYLKTLQLEIHDVFIEMVRERRGDVLSEDPNIFTGRFWTGRTARDLGLVDGIGDVRQVIKDRFGEDAELELIQPSRGFFGRRLLGLSAEASGSTEDLGTAIGAGVVREGLSSLEDRALWARYGL
ncbi:S49 family peptidase [Roseibium aestuarii]|uniref:S49 family peptidase n=1 Tax=Roseibium aestuarii TaxID=2600299 RepID=A0ABW4JT01_9HYPH